MHKEQGNTKYLWQVASCYGKNREEVKNVGQDVGRIGQIGFLAHDLIDNMAQK